MNTHDYDLLIRLSLAHPDEDELSAIARHIDHVSDWDAWYAIADFNRMIPQVHHTLENQGLLASLPERIVHRMKAEAMKVRVANSLRNKEAKRFLTEFKANDIPVAILKGVAFGETVYHNPAYKRMNDIDILIQKKDIDAIYATYDALGYFYIGERVGGDKQKSDALNHVGPPYVSPDMHCVIGTQWGIKSPLSPYQIDYQGIWDRMVPLNFMGLELKTLSPEDHLHHLCLHLGRYKISLRDMMDFYNVIRENRETFNWDLFEKIVEETGSERPVFIALSYSRYVYPLHEMATYLSKIEAKATTTDKHRIAWRTRSQDVFFNLYSDHLQTIEKTISAFDITHYFPEKAKHYIQLWKDIWFPPSDEVRRMAALGTVSTLDLQFARLRMPWNILSEIAQEIGWKLVFLLMVKVNLDVLKSFLQWPFISKKEHDTQAYATKRGISLTMLNQLKTHFQ